MLPQDVLSISLRIFKESDMNVYMNSIIYIIYMYVVSGVIQNTYSYMFV